MNNRSHWASDLGRDVFAAFMYDVAVKPLLAQLLIFAVGLKWGTLGDLGIHSESWLVGGIIALIVTIAFVVPIIRSQLLRSIRDFNEETQLQYFFGFWLRLVVILLPLVALCALLHGQLEVFHEH